MNGLKYQRELAGAAICGSVRCQFYLADTIPLRTENMDPLCGAAGFHIDTLCNNWHK